MVEEAFVQVSNEEKVKNVKRQERPYLKALFPFSGYSILQETNQMWRL